MKLLHTKTLKDGRVHVLIELGAIEAFPVAPIREDGYYKLNYPMDDTIIAGRILCDPQRVMWDSYSQKWVEA